MASLLKQAGCRVVFVLYAMEMPWYWYFDEPAYREMVETWDEVHVYPASKHVGLPPQHGRSHNLDEWWDPAFEQFLIRLADIEKFDIVMVTNVWLFKAFYVAGPTVFTILDTLDVFCERLEIAARTGINPEFFWLNPTDEVFGWNQSDLVITVTNEESKYFGEGLIKPVISIPIVSTNVPRLARRQTYLYEDRVIFGVLSSAQVYTVIGLNEVLAELEKCIEQTFAPVDILIAGTISDHVKTTLPVRKLGTISSEESFFDQVDFIFAPQFDGTGFKVKVADAMMAGVPILTAQHSGVGTFLPESLLYSSPKALAAAMTRIALERPALSRFNALITKATHSLIAERDRSERQLMNAIGAARGALVFDLRRLSATDHFPIILSYISWTRIMSASASLFVLVDDALKQVVENIRNRWYRVVTEAELSDFLSARPEVFSIGPFPSLDLPRHECDSRWNWLVEDARKEDAWGQTREFLAYLPYLHADLVWLPGLMALVRSVGMKQSLKESVRRIAVTEDPKFASILGHLWGEFGLAIVVSDRLAMRTLIANLLVLPTGVDLEIQWFCATQTPEKDLIYEIAVSKQIPFFGFDPHCETRYEDIDLYAGALVKGMQGVKAHIRSGVTVR